MRGHRPGAPRLSRLVARFAVILLLAPWTGASLAGESVPAATTAPPSAHAGDEPPAELVLEEIVVRGTRLWQLRQAMVEAEDRFYARYNELNQNDDFDVSCSMEAPLGTRLKQRICRVAFQADAEADHAQALVTGRHAPNPQIVIFERQQEYRLNALAIIKGDRRLQALARDRERLQKSYEEERARRFKGRWILFE